MIEMQNITIVFNETGHKTEINIERRLTYLTGLSGVGKSTFVTLLQSGEDLQYRHLFRWCICMILTIWI